MASKHAATAGQISEPPKGREKLKWLAPGILWMIAAAGSGELLFTPRIGSMYGYTMVWAMFVSIGMKWLINREVGRFTVCTGSTVLDGFSRLKGPSNWALYLVILPQVVVAVSAIAGLAGSAATAIILFSPGSVKIWTIVLIILSSALVTWGKFTVIERIASVVAVVLSLAALTAAISIFRNPQALAAGLVPSFPENLEQAEVLPWLGFVLSGAAGMIWYSFWIQKKQMGATAAGKDLNVRTLGKKDQEKLKGWIRHITIDNTIAVTGTTLITLAFLVLGSELLKPEGLVPDENKVASTLGQLLGKVWGPFGFWFMITGLMIGFWSTVISNQDGFGRMFAGGTANLLANLRVPARWKEESFLRKFFVVVLVSIAPSILYLVVGEPVGLLKVAGAIEASHIPLLAVLVLYMNYKQLSPGLRPGIFTRVGVIISAMFFAAFAISFVV